MAALLRPRRLQSGDTIALLSPASPPEKTRVSQAVRRLRQLGYQTSLGANALVNKGYLAGTDEQRRYDWTAALRNPAIRAILFTRGGYGVSRLLEKPDKQLHRLQPKIVLGYSDLTLLHLQLQRFGWVSFWGPMPACSTGLTPFALLWMEKALAVPKPIGPLPQSGGVLVSGQAQGRITGGTLSLLAASLGTPYEIVTQNRIVFLEDIGEEAYRIDRFLTQLLAAGKLKDAAAIVLGAFVHCPSSPQRSRPQISVQSVLADRLRPLRVPILTDFPIGHIPDQVTLPYGVMAKITTRTRRLEILEPAVK